jgi:hypothetical protein
MSSIIHAVAKPAPIAIPKPPCIVNMTSHQQPTVIWEHTTTLHSQYDLTPTTYSHVGALNHLHS